MRDSNESTEVRWLEVIDFVCVVTFKVEFGKLFEKALHDEAKSINNRTTSEAKTDLFGLYKKFPKIGLSGSKVNT